MATRITEEEKLAIVELYKSGKFSYSQISDITKRSENSVVKIIEAFREEEPDFVQEKPRTLEQGAIYVSNKIIEDTIYKFYNEGIDRDEAETIVKSVIPYLTNHVTSVKQMYEIVVKTCDAGKLGNSKTKAGNSGVFVMTESLSQKADADKKEAGVRKPNPNIFHPND